MRFSGLWLLILTLSSPCLLMAEEDQTPLRVIETDKQTGFAVAVRVGNSALAHTSQLLPTSAAGEVIAPDNVKAQTAALLTRLAETLKLAGTDLSQLVKLNLYLANDTVADEAVATLREKLPARSRPAISLVSGKLAKPGVLIALDAVAVVPGDGPAEVTHHPAPQTDHKVPALVSVLPRGGVVYISGQAEKGENLAACAKSTLAGLQKTLEHLSLERRHVVQLKSFLEPMTELAGVEAELAAHFADAPIPAHVPVEWTTAGRIEIELIAHIPADNTAEPLRFGTPPWMTASPVFSRLAIVQSPNRVYIAGLYGDQPAGQIPGIFEQLKSVLEAAGSNFDNLAKATYYVSEDSSSQELNEFRPSVYNPERPPAASKAAVRGVGRAGRNVTVDMIAVIPK